MPAAKAGGARKKRPAGGRRRGAKTGAEPGRRKRRPALPRAWPHRPKEGAGRKRLPGRRGCGRGMLPGGGAKAGAPGKGREKGAKKTQGARGGAPCVNSKAFYLTQRPLCKLRLHHPLRRGARGRRAGGMRGCGGRSEGGERRAGQGGRRKHRAGKKRGRRMPAAKAGGARKKRPAGGRRRGAKTGAEPGRRKRRPALPRAWPHRPGGGPLPPKKPLQTKAPSLCLSNASHSPSSFISSVNLQTAGTLPLPEETFSTRPA